MKSASGFQIAFFIFAVALLAAPLSDHTYHRFEIAAELLALLDWLIPFIVATVVLLGFPALRRKCADELAKPIPRDRVLEVALVTAAKAPYSMAMAGAVALVSWWTAGASGLASIPPNPDKEMARALSATGILFSTLLGAVIAPVIEELVFRGFLYRAWERRFGWIASMLLTSAVFGLYHKHFFAAFMSSIVFVCLLRRTGTLWAAILVHAFGNLILWYLLLGRWVFTPHAGPVEELSSWWVQLVCLAFIAVALPIYVWMARHERTALTTA